MAIFNGYFALGTEVSNTGVFNEATGYTRPACAFSGTALGGLWQSLGAVSGITGPAGGKVTEGGVFDALTGGNCLCRWRWMTSTPIPGTFAAVTVSIAFNSSTTASLNLSATGGPGTSGSIIDQGAQIGQVNGAPLIATNRLSIQSGALVSFSSVPSPVTALVPQSVVATGTTQLTAAPLSATLSLVTAPTAGFGVTVAPLIGQVQTICNIGSNSLNVWPLSNMALASSATNAAITLQPGGSFGIVLISLTQAYVIYNASVFA